MAASCPYTRYVCPCSDLAASDESTLTKHEPKATGKTERDGGADTFDSSNPRADFALYPLDHLLYCDECDAIRCPRCWTEEVINWYCPSCLFEVPSSAVKGDGNRCSRNCYNCPCCTAPLAITAVSSSPSSDDHLKPADSVNQETYILQCQYCEWSSLDANIQLSRPTKITEQLTRLRKSRGWKPPEPDSMTAPVETRRVVLDHDDAFANLSAFYKEQLSESRDWQSSYVGSPYASPANLARIMSMYGGMAYGALKKSRQKPQPMREANSLAEGLVTMSLTDEDSDHAILEKMHTFGWEGTASSDQQSSAPTNNSAKFVDELWPVATALRTRRGKRCSSCRQFLTRPDPKVGSVKYRIRLLALNFTPSMTMRPLQPSLPVINDAFRLRIEDVNQITIPRFVPQHYVLTVRNPIFETVKITLATPAITPGKLAARVTILCPSFTVGPAGDVWEEALSSSAIPSKNDVDGGRQAAMASLTGKSDADRQPEAGKIWERSRNTTSVIVEVVLTATTQPDSSTKTLTDTSPSQRTTVHDDDEILEVPVYVRVEWEAQVDETSQGLGRKEVEKKGGASGGESKVSKQLGYWCVLGLGRAAA